MTPEQQAEVRSLEDESGKVKAEDVVALASNPESAIHSLFTWDDSEAAHQYRLIQARHVIVRVRYVYEEHEEVRIPGQVYHSLPSDRSQPGGGYTNTTKIIDDPERYQELLEAAARELNRVLEKYRQIKELDPVRSSLEDVVERELGVQGGAL